MEDMLPIEWIVKRIFLLRGHKVILDNDIATLYQVPTYRLNEQVRRNIKRFPPDFMFQLSPKEMELLRSQIAISKVGRGGRRYAPLAFTEQGVAMLSTVLNSEQAILVNITIMRAFVKLREILASHKELAKRLDDLEKKYDVQFKAVFDAIRALMTQPSQAERRIGFRQDKI